MRLYRVKFPASLNDRDFSNSSLTVVHDRGEAGRKTYTHNFGTHVRETGIETEPGEHIQLSLTLTDKDNNEIVLPDASATFESGVDDALPANEAGLTVEFVNEVLPPPPPPPPPEPEPEPEPPAPEPEPLAPEPPPEG